MKRSINKDGRTYSMANFLADAIQDGETEAVVVFATMRIASLIGMPMVSEALKRRGIKSNMGGNHIYGEGFIIYFIPNSEYIRFTTGRVTCEFIDHHAFATMSPDQKAYSMMRQQKSPITRSDQGQQPSEEALRGTEHIQPI